MPALWDFYQTHVHHHNYLVEITLCERNDCVHCHQSIIGRSVRTPNTQAGALRSRVLSPMTRPVLDPANKGHCMKPEAARKHIIENDLSLEVLKLELPAMKSNPNTSKEYEEDKVKDRKHDKVWRGNCVCDVVRCDECGFVRCIFSEYVLKNQRRNINFQRMRWKGAWDC